MVEIESYSGSLQGPEQQTSLMHMLTRWEQLCNNCHPLTPVECITRCKIWKLKNEFRKLYKKMKEPNFMTNLLNTLKNKRRLYILETISKGRYSIASLQQQMKKLGYSHGQRTIAEEYLNPLIKAGLAEENQNYYFATMFGCRLSELVKNFPDIGDILPLHSECYEEMTLDMLLGEPKTYEDFREVVPSKTVGRILSRLQKAGLIETAKERDHIFYFKTKRDSSKTGFCPTERRIYDNISVDGDSVRNLAEKSGISIRRTYKYLKKLKGKKMIFSRNKPRSYALTAEGTQIATILHGIHDLTTDALTTAAQLVRDNKSY